MTSRKIISSIIVVAFLSIIVAGCNPVKMADPPASTRATLGTSGNVTAFTVSNAFKSSSRASTLDLTTYQLPGFTISSVELNIIDNEVKAADDWVNLHAVDDASYTDIESNLTGNNLNERLSQKIHEYMRFEMLNATLRVRATTTNPACVAPTFEIFDDNLTDADGSPDTSIFSMDFVKSTSGAITWASVAPHFIINASAPANNTVYAVLAGDDWGVDINSDAGDTVRWYCGSATNTSHSWCWYQDIIEGWAQETRDFDFAYQRMILNDANNSARKFATNSMLQVNSTDFNATGGCVVSGSAMTALVFTSNVTSCAFDVDMVFTYVSSSWDHASPFTITSNADFPTYASSGSGSAIDPWIIENFTIDAGAVFNGGAG
nr:hypothetical protein [Candidatus Sigynarchaeota archaeon]